MKDLLTDIVKQTSSFDVIKITGTETGTRVQAVATSKTLILDGVTKAPIAEFKGEFGITNLSLLKGLLDFTSYRADGSTFEVKRREMHGQETVEQFSFRDARGSGADFRLMSKDRVPGQPEIRNIPWDVTITPDKSKVAEFQSLAGMLSDVDKRFSAKTDSKGNLLFMVGDENSSTHRANMVFAEQVEGTLKGTALWETSELLAVLKIAGESAEIKITDRGIISISVETPHGRYNYYLRGSSR